MRPTYYAFVTPNIAAEILYDIFKLIRIVYIGVYDFLINFNIVIIVTFIHDCGSLKKKIKIVVRELPAQRASFCTCLTVRSTNS